MACISPQWRQGKVYRQFDVKRPGNDSGYNEISQRMRNEFPKGKKHRRYRNRKWDIDFRSDHNKKFSQSFRNWCRHHLFLKKSFSRSKKCEPNSSLSYKIGANHFPNYLNIFNVLSFTYKKNLSTVIFLKK